MNRNLRPILLVVTIWVGIVALSGFIGEEISSKGSTTGAFAAIGLLFVLVALATSVMVRVFPRAVDQNNGYEKLALIGFALSMAGALYWVNAVNVQDLRAVPMGILLIIVGIIMFADNLHLLTSHNGNNGN